MFDFDSSPARPIDQFGSQGAAVTPLTTPDGDAHVACVRLGPGGVLGRHAGETTQAFVVVQGEGWVSGPDRERRPVAAGTVVFWNPGEEHETGTDVGLTAIVTEAPRLNPERHTPGADA